MVISACMCVWCSRPLQVECVKLERKLGNELREKMEIIAARRDMRKQLDQKLLECRRLEQQVTEAMAVMPMQFIPTSDAAEVRPADLGVPWLTSVVLLALGTRVRIRHKSSRYAQEFALCTRVRVMHRSLYYTLCSHYAPKHVVHCIAYWRAASKYTFTQQNHPVRIFKQDPFIDRNS